MSFKEVLIPCEHDGSISFQNQIKCWTEKSDSRITIPSASFHSQFNLNNKISINMNVLLPNL